MPFLADLHLHSPWSRATSPAMSLEQLNVGGQRKGIQVLATGDVTHPQRFKEIREKLEPAEEGLFRLKAKHSIPGDPPVQPSYRMEIRFMLTGEISCIYKRHGKTRKVHNVIALPNLAGLEKFNKKCASLGNIHSDGRPILGLDSRDLLEILLEASREAVLVPAHAWTPHFSIFGSFTDFQNIEEAFGDLSQHIFAIETGLSSDPPMNWRLSQLDKIALLSNGDAHSLDKIGREANVFNCGLSYPEIWDAVRRRDPEKFLGTIEFFPEEGKYHLDGHRDCGVCLHPRETRQAKGICPKCGKKVVIGVMNQVEKMADRPENPPPPNGQTFESLIPLREILSQLEGVGVQSRRVGDRYFQLLAAGGSEMKILREIPLPTLAEKDPDLAAALAQLRAGKVEKQPGYDGEYGVIKIIPAAVKKQAQLALF